MLKLFRFKDLAGEGVPYCRMHLNRLEQADKFPKRIRLGPNTVAWLADEVRGYVEEKIAGRDHPRDSAVVAGKEGTALRRSRRSIEMASRDQLQRAAASGRSPCPGFDAAVKERNIPTLGQRLGPDKPRQGDGE